MVALVVDENFPILTCEALLWTQASGSAFSDRQCRSCLISRLRGHSPRSYMFLTLPGCHGKMKCVKVCFIWPSLSSCSLSQEKKRGVEEFLGFVLEQGRGLESRKEFKEDEDKLFTSLSPRDLPQDGLPCGLRKKSSSLDSCLSKLPCILDLLGQMKYESKAFFYRFTW